MKADRAARILTVCLGNICRSPTAEAALLEAAQEAGLAFEVASAGTGDWHIGHAPHPPMAAAAHEAGLQLHGTAQQVDPDLLTWADLVLVMDRKNLADVRRMASEAGIATPVRLFRTFDPEPGTPVQDATRAYADDEVPDPYGGEASGFEEVVRICRRTSRSIIERWPEPQVAS
jgi:protein-tyrosine phosphatase